MQPHLFQADTALVTLRTVVRRFRENEGESFYQLVSENLSRLTDYFPQTLEAVTNKDTGEAYVRQKIADWLLQNEYCFGVWEHKNAKLVGFVRVFNILWGVPAGELAFFIDKNFEGKGIMTEVVQAAIRFSFEDLKIEKLRLRTATDNYATQRLARKCGFRREGDLRAEFRRPSGELIDVMLFGYTKAEFEKV
jgi:RimJ/RimL family protein N-acetyltransferase